MLKRILFTFFTLLILYSAILVGYRVFEPNRDDSHDINAQDAIVYDALHDYTLSSGNASLHYYFFSSSTNADCKYVKDTILQTASINTGIDVHDYIEEVDITPLEQNFELYRLNDDWGISSYPAFVACIVEDNKIVIQNRLEWDPQHPLSVDNFVDWLILNRIYDAQPSETPIETPAP